MSGLDRPQDGQRYCGRLDTRLYLIGARCVAHRPAHGAGYRGGA